MHGRSPAKLPDVCRDPPAREVSHTAASAAVLVFHQRPLISDEELVVGMVDTSVRGAAQLPPRAGRSVLHQRPRMGGTGILAALITIFTAGICYPFALVLLERWRCKHTYIDGQRLVFTGTGIGLFGLWIKWFVLIVITLGIYSFWVAPRIQQ